jgi:hypothetical protein
MVVRPRFTTDATGARFAVLFVTPSRPIVETVPDQFVELAQLTAPKTEFREIEVEDPALGTRCETVGCGGGAPRHEPAGCGGGPSFDPPNVGDGGLGDGQVGVEQIGPYDIVRATPADATELAALLDSFSYRYEQADLDAIVPYLARGYTVVAVRVAIEAASPAGRAMTPIAMTWAGSELRLPVALGSESVDLKVFIAADGRYDFPGAEVPFAQPNYWSEARFLTLNKLHAITGGSPDDDPVATRVEGDPAFHEVNVVERIVPVPVSRLCDQGDDDIGCCRACNTGARPRVRFDWIVVAGVVVLVLRKRRRVTARR